MSELPNDSKMAEAERKKRIAPLGSNPLKILDLSNFLLAEVALQQAFERLTMSRLVAGHTLEEMRLNLETRNLIRPYILSPWQARRLLLHFQAHP